MGAFRTIIGYNPQQYDSGSFEPTRYLILDTQEDKNINADATIAQQPLQSGDTMSDHMYRNPTQVSISGMFSLNGKNWNDDSYNFIEAGDRLTNVEQVFEQIKDQGFLCRLTTIDEDDVSLGESGIINLKSNAKTRFKIRNNMALKSIVWAEKQNTVKFTFTFVEVIMVEAQEYEELPEDEKNKYGLPSVTSPVGSSLGTLLKDTGQLKETILRTLYDNGYVQDDFFKALCVEVYKLTENALIATAIITVGMTVSIITTIPAAIAITVAATTGGSVVAALAGSCSAVFPVGTIVVAVVAVVAGIAIGIARYVQWKKKQEKQKKAFKLINGKPDQDAQRLFNLFDDVEMAVNRAKSNLTIYNITGNYAQTVTINIGGEYYLITFEKSNVDKDQVWSATVTDLNGNALTGVYHAWCPVSAFTELDRNQNLWFKDNSKQYEVYLVNPSLSKEINKTQEEMNNAKANLEGYTIWVSKGTIKDNIKAVTDAIEQAIESEGFK